MFILKTGHQPGVYVPLRALFLVFVMLQFILKIWLVDIIFLIAPGVYSTHVGIHWG